MSLKTGSEYLKLKSPLTLMPTILANPRHSRIHPWQTFQPQPRPPTCSDTHHGIYFGRIQEAFLGGHQNQNVNVITATNNIKQLLTLALANDSSLSMALVYSEHSSPAKTEEGTNHHDHQGPLLFALRTFNIFTIFIRYTVHKYLRMNFLSFTGYDKELTLSCNVFFSDSFPPQILGVI